MLINYDVLVDLSTSVIGPTHFRNTQRVFFFLMLIQLNLYEV